MAVGSQKLCLCLSVSFHVTVIVFTVTVNSQSVNRYCKCIHAVFSEVSILWRITGILGLITVQYEHS